MAIVSIYDTTRTTILVRIDNTNNCLGVYLQWYCSAGVCCFFFSVFSGIRYQSSTVTCSLKFESFVNVGHLCV